MKTSHTDVGRDAQTAVQREALNVMIYVHLCSGEVIEISPATGVRLMSDELLVLNGEKVAAAFSRPDVYLTSDAPMEPPSCE